MSSRAAAEFERRRLAAEREERIRLREARRERSTSDTSEENQTRAATNVVPVQQVTLEVFNPARSEESESEDEPAAAPQHPVQPPQVIPPPPIFAPMAQQGSRLRYGIFKGREGEDPDTFLQKFDKITIANRESTEVDKVRIFPALLHKRAAKWVHGLDIAVRQNWVQLRESFLNEFMDLDFDSRVIGKLNRLRRKKKESLRRYTQRFRDLVDQTDNVGLKQQIECSEEEVRKRRSDKGKKKAHKRRTRRPPSSSESSSEEECRPRSKTAHHRKSEDKAQGTTSNVDVVAKELSELKIQLADEKKRRKSPSAPRYGLWCSNCWGHGHSKDDCRMPSAPKPAGQSSNAHWVESDVINEEFFWVDEQGEPLYQVQTTPSFANMPRFAPVRYSPA
ncbi:hypothetical protein R1sor_022553 [Riccia sorocarpa]|uniref:Retrotransposon gag domain-containing protein n=1 Tax=Riccia sorocarpa TaxID=122646 RepID=A0ABD3GN66_9MARC